MENPKPHPTFSKEKSWKSEAGKKKKLINDCSFLLLLPAMDELWEEEAGSNSCYHFSPDKKGGLSPDPAPPRQNKNEDNPIHRTR